MELAIDHTMTSADSAYYQTLSTHDLPHEPLATCILRAAKKVKVHPDYLYTLSMAEGGRAGKYNQNRDGTHDIGVMQINYERWAVEFPRIGYKIDWRKVLKKTCSNVEAGAIIFRYRAKGVQDELTAMANYHWYSTVKNNGPHLKYKKRVAKIYLALLQDKQKFNQSGDLNPKLRCRYADCR